MLERSDKLPQQPAARCCLECRRVFAWIKISALVVVVRQLQRSSRLAAYTGTGLVSAAGNEVRDRSGLALSQSLVPLMPPQSMLGLTLGFFQPHSWDKSLLRL